MKFREAIQNVRDWDNMVFISLQIYNFVICSYFSIQGLDSDNKDVKKRERGAEFHQISNFISDVG